MAGSSSHASLRGAAEGRSAARSDEHIQKAPLVQNIGLIPHDLHYHRRMSMGLTTGGSIKGQKCGRVMDWLGHCRFIQRQAMGGMIFNSWRWMNDLPMRVMRLGVNHAGTFINRIRMDVPDGLTDGCAADGDGSRHASARSAARMAPITP